MCPPAIDGFFNPPYVDTVNNKETTMDELVKAAFRAIQEMEAWDEMEVELHDRYYPIRIDLSMGIKVLKDALNAMGAKDE
jgi:hypothetical protein